jgi:hypothetical protein
MGGGGDVLVLTGDDVSESPPHAARVHTAPAKIVVERIICPIALPPCVSANYMPIINQVSQGPHK